MKQKKTHREQTGGCQGGGGGRGMEWEVGFSRWKLLYIELDKPQGPTVQHRELYSISYDKS